MNRQILFNFLLSIAYYFTKLSCIINLPYLTALIIKFSLRKSTFILTKKKTTKTIIVLEKSYGTDDLIESYKNKISDINFLILQRQFFRVIFQHFLGRFSKDQIRETKYLTNDPYIENQKIKYRFYLIKTIQHLKKLQNFDSFLSFNLFYITERELQQACKKLNTKFIVCHKESVCTKKLNKLRVYMWNKLIGKCFATAICVYNNYTRDSMISSRVIDKNKITVSGMPRADNYFKKEKENKKKYRNYILFLMIERNAQLPYVENYWFPSILRQNIKFFTWKKNAHLTTKTILDFAKSRPDLNFIFKTKPKTSEEEFKLFRKYSLNNCKLIQGGSSTDLIKNSKYIIAFNTTGIFEGMILNKKIIVPTFQNNKIEKGFTFSLNNKDIYQPRTIKKMKYYLESLSNIKNNSEKIKIKKVYIKYIKEHLCNTDGKAGRRLRKFISDNI